MDSTPVTDSSVPMMSLRNIAINKILSSRNCHQVIQMYDVGIVTGHLDIAEEAKSFVSDKFAYFIERYGEEQLKDVLTEKDFNEMLSVHNERLKIEKRLSLKGSVIEREAIQLTESEVQDGFYPLKSLLPGVAWPSDVDPAKREQYLNPNEFEKTFGMTKESFNAIDDKHKKLQLKKDRGLF